MAMQHSLSYLRAAAAGALLTTAMTVLFLAHISDAAAVPTLVALPNIDPNITTAPSVRGLSCFGNNIYLSTSGAAGRRLLRYNTADGTLKTIYGQSNSGVCTPAGDVGSPGKGLVLSTSPSIDALSDDQIVFSMGMPASQVIWTRLNPNSAATVISASSRLIGADCSYIQAPWVIPDAGYTVFTQMPPLDAVKYRHSTQQLFIATYRGVLVATNGTVYPFYGNLSDGYADLNASIVRPLVRHRDTANTKGCGQLSLLGDSFLVVPESGLQSVSLIDLNTGDVTFAVGATLTAWPPPYACLVSTSGCDARNFSLWEASASATVGNRYLYLTAILFPAIYRVDLQLNSITLVGGNIPKEVSGVDVVMPTFSVVRHLGIAAASNMLYIASNIGLLSLGLPDRTASAVAPPTKAFCNITHDCVHAVDVIGLPPAFCRCICKPRYAGERCEINLNTKTVSLPVVIVIVPVQPIQTVAVATVSTVTVLTSVVTPSMGTQGSRGVFLLDLQQCNTDLQNALDFTASPTQLVLGHDELRFMFGTVVGNAALIIGILLANFIGAKLYQYSKHITAEDAQARTRFPSLAVFPILFVVEGTAYAATTLIVTSTATVTHRIIGAVVLVLEYCLFFAVVFYMRYYFACKFVEFTAEEAMPAPSFTFAYVQAVARRLLHITGKWHDANTQSFQVKRLGGLFKEYRQDVRAFILFEMGLSIASGTLTGLKPLACNTVVILIVFAFLFYMIGVFWLKPCMSRIQNATLMLIALLQTASAALTAISVYIDSAELATTGNNITLAALFVVAVTGFAGFIERLYRIARFFASGGRQHRGPVSNETFISDAPPLEMGLMPREQTQTPSTITTSNSHNSMLLTIGDNGPIAASNGNGLLDAQQPFANFSFTRLEVDQPRRAMALPTPDTPVVRSRRIDALRRELDDLISGRVDGQRFDALLADAAQHDSSGSGGSSFQRQSSDIQGTTSSSHRSSATRQSSSQLGSTNDLQALEAAALRSSMHRRSASNLSFTSIMAAAANANRSFNVGQTPGSNSTTTTTTTSGSANVRRRGAIEPQML